MQYHDAPTHFVAQQQAQQAQEAEGAIDGNDEELYNYDNQQNQTPDGLTQSNTAPVGPSGASAMNNNTMMNTTQAEFEQFLEWKKMKMMESQKGNVNSQPKPIEKNSKKRDSNRGGISLIVMNEKEKLTYKDFLKEKKNCYELFDSLSFNDSSDTNETDNNTKGSENKHPFGSLLSNISNSLNNNFEKAGENYGLMIQLFEEMEEKCNKQWKMETMDTIDEKQTEMPETPGGDGTNSPCDYDTIQLMKSTINFCQTYTNKIKNFKRDLALNLNTIQSILDQFDVELESQKMKTNVNNFDYQKWNTDTIANSNVEYVQPGTPTSITNADLFAPNLPSKAQTVRVYGNIGNGNNMNNNNQSNTPPPDYLHMTISNHNSNITPIHGSPGQIDLTGLQPKNKPGHYVRSSSGVGSVTIDPPSLNIDYASADDNVALSVADSYGPGPLSPGSRISTIKQFEQNQDNDMKEEVIQKQINYMASSRYHNVSFKDNNIDSGLLICNYKIKQSEHEATTIVFTPSINSMFHSTNNNGKHGTSNSFEHSFSQNENESAISGLSGTKSNLAYNESKQSGGIFGGSPAKTETMEVKLTKCDCNFQLLKGGYDFQVGLVILPRKHKVLELQNQFSKMQQKKDNDCYLHDFTEKNDLFKNFSTYYMSFRYFTGAQSTYRCCFGKNKYRDYVTLYYDSCEYDKNYCFKANDTVKIQIEQTHLKSHYLSFYKNGKLMGENINKNQNGKETEFKNGRIKLNFSKFRYLFAISSIRCECKTTLIKKRKFGGFEFECSFKAKNMSN